MKVIARIKGGLGNQLFAYAAARRLALVNNCELILDSITGFIGDYEYKRSYELDLFSIPFRFALPGERFEPFGRVRRKSARVLGSLLGASRSSYIAQDGMEFMNELLTLRLNRDVYLDGYWQSEDYFKDFSREIRSDLIINPLPLFKRIPISPELDGGTSIAVHLRFFDDPESNGHHNVTSDYYRNAVAQMNNLIKDPHYYIFSDKPNEARAIMEFSKGKKTFVDTGLALNERRDVAEFWIMSRCQNFIIANSTFSWWAAWLGSSKNKVVIAPSKKIIGKTVWGIDRQIPDDWIKV